MIIKRIPKYIKTLNNREYIVIIGISAKFIEFSKSESFEASRKAS